jgi:replicative DNA helicase
MTAATFDRLPPQNIEAEQSVLGAIIQDRGAYDTVSSVLKADDFYREPHQKLYTVICDLMERDGKVDIVTLSEELRNRGILDAVGGLAYIMVLLDSAILSHNTELHAAIVREKASLRTLIECSTESATECYSPEAEADVIASRLQDRLLHALGSRTTRAFRPMRELAPETWEAIVQRMQSEGAPGTPTGYRLIDNQTAGGPARGELWYVAARPKVGKTAWLGNVAINAAHRGKSVAFVSLEMPTEQIMLRLYAMKANLNILALRTGDLTDQDLPMLTEAMGWLSELPLYIADARDLGDRSVRGISHHLRRLRFDLNRAGQTLDLVGLDQLSKIKPARDRSIYENTTAASNDLKGLAMDLDVPVICLHQLNRSIEKEDREPRLDDLRDSGATEADADLVAFLHREGADRDLDPDATYPVHFIAKVQRNGPPFRIKLRLEGRTTRFLEEDLHYA